jgi:uncharacterized protein (TIGR02145 family)
VRCLKDEAPANQAPGAPSNPIPQSGSTNQVLNIDISWNCTDPEGDPLTFDIYFGNLAPPPQVATNQASTTYIPATLAGNTQYFWKIVAHDNHGNTTEGPVWNFTTMAAPQQCGSQITDPRDGKTYSTVQIGTQCWMAQNLNIGTRINSPTDQSQNGIIEKYCYNDTETECDTYGGLYQWDEIMNYTTTEGVQGICMAGWHIPTIMELIEMRDYLGIDSAGGAMKEAGTIHWSPPNLGATNSSGFTALPGGFRYLNGVTYSQSTICYGWSSTQVPTTDAYLWMLTHDIAEMWWVAIPRQYGVSVRCLKNN